LLPQYAREVLSEGHLACFFIELREALDFNPILKAYTQECGQPPYHPVMMALLVMYAYARGITSSREIEKRWENELREDGGGHEEARRADRQAACGGLGAGCLGGQALRQGAARG
jgi:hypothetical protein